MSVEELLIKKDIFYKHAGKDLVVSCLNPEHPDNNPSMRIDRLTGAFNCFSCSFRGNLFAYFDETVDTTNVLVVQLKNKIREILMNEFILPLGTEPFKRKFRDIEAETFEHFEAFLHDNYEGRIVFPIKDITGALKGVIGRRAFSDINPKYYIEPSGASLPIFPPKPDLYKESLIVVEGIFDLLNLYDKGVTNVVCTFGKQLGDVKNKNKRETNLTKFIPLKIQGVKKIYVVYDDGALNSAERLAKLVSPLIPTEAIDYPLFSSEKDVGNLNKQEVEKLMEFIYDPNSNNR